MQAHKPSSCAAFKIVARHRPLRPKKSPRAEKRALGQAAQNRGALSWGVHCTLHIAHQLQPLMCSVQCQLQKQAHKPSSCAAFKTVAHHRALRPEKWPRPKKGPRAEKKGPWAKQLLMGELILRGALCIAQLLSVSLVFNLASAMPIAQAKPLRCF